METGKIKRKSNDKTGNHLFRQKRGKDFVFLIQNKYAIKEKGKYLTELKLSDMILISNINQKNFSMKGKNLL